MAVARQPKNAGKRVGRPLSNTRKRIRSIYLEEDLDEKVRQISAVRDVSISAFIEQAVRDAVVATRIGERIIPIPPNVKTQCPLCAATAESGYSYFDDECSCSACGYVCYTYDAPEMLIIEKILPRK